MNLDEEARLRGEITSCTRCDLHRSRLHAVPGEGPLDARVFLIGEGPGREEDRQGLPFVGRAGTVLNELLTSIGMERGQVFITSVVKCRPPGNRSPNRGESRTCRPYLMRQLALINPDLVVPMGQWATWDLFELFGMEDRPFRDVRGKAIRVTSSGKEWVLHPTFHPAVITHNPNLRKGLEQDFRSLAAILRELPVRRD